MRLPILLPLMLLIVAAERPPGADSKFLGDYGSKLGADLATALRCGGDRGWLDAVRDASVDGVRHRESPQAAEQMVGALATAEQQETRGSQPDESTCTNARSRLDNAARALGLGPDPMGPPRSSRQADGADRAEADRSVRNTASQ